MNLNVRKGDNVKVLTGKDKGKTGKVMATDPKTGKVLVEGVNIATHHRKARSAGEQSAKVTVEAPLDVSNVQIVCPSCGKSVRVRNQEADGKHVRVCAKCGASLDVAVKADKTKKKADKKAKKAKDEASASEEAAEKPAKPAKKAQKANDETPESEQAAEKPAKPAKKAKKVPVDSESDGKTDKE